MTPTVITEENAAQRIVILQRGFVYAGDVHFDGEWVVINNCINLRHWGTETGLGELAQRGNTSSTIADPCAPVRAHQLSIVAMMDCEAELKATTKHA